MEPDLPTAARFDELTADRLLPWHWRASDREPFVRSAIAADVWAQR